MPPIAPNPYLVPANPPPDDPAPIFELYRGFYETELMVAASAHLGLFRLLDGQSLGFEALRGATQLSARAMNVVLTGLRAMGLVAFEEGAYRLTPQAQNHLAPNSPHSIADYIHQAAENPGVVELANRLRTGKPKGAAAHEQGAGFIFREGLKSAMEEEAAARKFTLQLAGRAKNVAPALAETLPLAGSTMLLDVGGGTGIYTIALLRKNPGLRAIIWDRPEVLKVAADFVSANGVADRVELVPGDMFASPVPQGADVTLLSNILHDWDVPECEKLLARCASALGDGGRLLIHDAFLHDDLSGPLSVAMYSLALYTLTEGRAYSVAEYTRWLLSAGIQPVDVVPTLIHCGAVVGVRR